MSTRAYRLATRCAHGGARRRGNDGANEPFQQPIVQSTIFDLGRAADAEAIFSGARKGYAYSRFGNPSVEALAEAIADMEGGAEALITSSGNAAILCAVTAALDGRSGPLVTHHDVYGGTSELLGILANIHRVPVEIVDATNAAAWYAAVSRAGAVMLETPSNPLMRLIDLKQTVAHAHASGAPVIVDNTVATPYNQRPFAFGVDWSVHSTSKYLNGHSDMIGGCLVRREPLSPKHRAIHKNLGGTVNAIDAWLVLRGLRTFALRMETHNRNGEAVAEWLLRHPLVTCVHYPGRGAQSQLEIFRAQMTHGGALLSFELAGGAQAACRFLDRIALVVHAVSLGGMESLATRPAMSSHRGVDPEVRRHAGVSDSLIRLSVGVEAIEDILGDLDQALAG
ncbi:MAG: PLP-dependent aspartate aminotransferase family protein [Candidatus Binatia bacterium]